MRTVQLHEFIKNVYQEYLTQQHDYLCSAAEELYGVGGRYALAKLLEESFPGRAYSGWAKPGVPWSLGATLPIDSMTDGYDLRENFVAKLLEQPDRTLVIPEVK